MKHLTILSVALLLLLSACHHATDSPVRTLPTPPGTLEKSVSSSGNTFGLGLFRQVSAAASRKNAFISPLSVSMALGMTLNGAAGTTRDSMLATLALNGLTAEQINSAYRILRLYLTQQDPTVAVQIVNSIWYRNTFSILPAFLQVNKDAFDAEISGLDFADPASVGTINAWVNAKTHGKITEIVTSIPDYMVMYLINAVYFKGTWTTQFKTDQTTDQPFTRQDGSTVTCKLMHQKTDLEYAVSGNLQVVDLPYGSGTFRMTIVLPPPGADLDSLAATVTPVQWAAWTSSLHKVDLEMYLPRFKMSFEYNLNGPLSDLGMGIAFSDAANFTGINATVPLVITEVKHKTYVEVNEEGTEAAAVTSVGVGVTSMGPVMRVDHPFLFAIREQASGALLFIGKIADPTQ